MQDKNNLSDNIEEIVGQIINVHILIKRYIIDAMIEDKEEAVRYTLLRY